MKKYEELTLEIITVRSADIIMTSSPEFEDLSFLSDGSIELPEIKLK